MINQERKELVMRHLERAYRASRPRHLSAQDWTKQRGDDEVEQAILDAISKLHRQGVPVTI